MEAHAAPIRQAQARHGVAGGENGIRLLRQELAQNEEKLAERKVVERAKGILMKGRNLSEDEAYRALRQQAMESNARLGDVARQVIALAGLLSK